MAPANLCFGNSPNSPKERTNLQRVFIGAAIGAGAIGGIGLAAIPGTLFGNLLVGTYFMSPLSVAIVSVKGFAFGIGLGGVYSTGLVAGAETLLGQKRVITSYGAGVAAAGIAVTCLFNYTAAGQAAIDWAKTPPERSVQVLQLKSSEPDARMTHVPDGRKIVFSKPG